MSIWDDPFFSNENIDAERENDARLLRERHLRECADQDERDDQEQYEDSDEYQRSLPRPDFRPPTDEELTGGSAWNQFERDRDEVYHGLGDFDAGEEA